MNGRLEKGSRLEGQKFSVGQEVFVSEDLGPYKAHFRSGENAVVLYAYGQSCGGDDVGSYGVEFSDGDESAWYEEDELTAVNTGLLSKTKRVLSRLI